MAKNHRLSATFSTSEEVVAGSEATIRLFPSRKIWVVTLSTIRFYRLTLSASLQWTMVYDGEEANMADKICALCGEAILKKPKNDPDSGTVEHVPPKMFYPESLRPELRKQLWTVPSHRRCNGGSKADEEYFYHYFYGLVGAENEDMGKTILADLKRQAKNPQARNLIKRVLSRVTNVSPGGILLPPTLIRVDCEAERLDSVVFKIARW